MISYVAFCEVRISKKALQGHQDRVSVQLIVGFNGIKTIAENSCYKQKQKFFKTTLKINFIVLKGCIFIHQF